MGGAEKFWQASYKNEMGHQGEMSAKSQAKEGGDVRIAGNPEGTVTKIGAGAQGTRKKDVLSRRAGIKVLQGKRGGGNHVKNSVAGALLSTGLRRGTCTHEGG